MLIFGQGLPLGMNGGRGLDSSVHGQPVLLIGGEGR